MYKIYAQLENIKEIMTNDQIAFMSKLNEIHIFVFSNTS